MLKDVESKAALIDATVHVKGTSLGGKTNEFGLVEIKNIPSSKKREVKWLVPLPSSNFLHQTVNYV